MTPIDLDGPLTTERPPDLRLPHRPRLAMKTPTTSATARDSRYSGIEIVIMPGGVPDGRTIESEPGTRRARPIRVPERRRVHVQRVALRVALRPALE